MNGKHTARYDTSGFCTRRREINRSENFRRLIQLRLNFSEFIKRERPSRRDPIPAQLCNYWLKTPASRSLASANTTRTWRMKGSMIIKQAFIHNSAIIGFPSDHYKRWQHGNMLFAGLKRETQRLKVENHILMLSGCGFARWSAHSEDPRAHNAAAVHHSERRHKLTREALVICNG